MDHVMQSKVAGWESLVCLHLIVCCQDSVREDIKKGFKFLIHFIEILEILIATGSSSTGQKFDEMDQNVDRLEYCVHKADNLWISAGFHELL